MQEIASTKAVQYETVGFTLCQHRPISETPTPSIPQSTYSASTNDGGGSLDDECFIQLEEDGPDEEKEGRDIEEREDEESKPKKAKIASAPWLNGAMNSLLVRSHFLRLHQEIIDFCDFVTASESEKDARDQAIQRVTSVVLSIWPESEVKVFGSYATGLFLPTSDVDMVVINGTFSSTVQGLRTMAAALTKKKVATELQVIGKAKVPIIKFVELESKICFDVSLDMTNGPDAAEFIRAAMAELPPLKPLCLVLKIYLLQRELNEVYKGGIGSYALIVMIIAFLQLHPSWRRSRSGVRRLEGNLGILLFDFFELYGRNLNVFDVGVSCRDGGAFFQKKTHSPPTWDSDRAYLLSIEDPQAVENDLGRNSYNVSRVRSSFVHAANLLTSQDEQSFPDHGILSRIIRMDSVLLERSFPDK